MWWNAPQGDVKVQLVSEKDDGPTCKYEAATKVERGNSFLCAARSLMSFLHLSDTIKQKINGTVGQASCKSEAPKGETCGTFKWRVPNFVRPGEYSVAVTSISHPDKSGWTDTVVVSKATSRKTSSRRTDKARIE